MSDRTVAVVLGCVVAVLLSFLVATAAALLARRDRATHSMACSRAAAAFGMTLALACSVTTALMAATR